MVTELGSMVAPRLTSKALFPVSSKVTESQLKNCCAPVLKLGVETRSHALELFPPLHVSPSDGFPLTTRLTWPLVAVFTASVGRVFCVSEKFPLLARAP